MGFAAGKTHHLNGLSLHTSNPFAVILVTSMDKAQDINTAKRLLVTTMARAKNTGMEVNADTTRLLKIGSAPILLEPVQVAINPKRKGGRKVYVCDHSGNRTSEQVPAVNGKFF